MDTGKKLYSSHVFILPFTIGSNRGWHPKTDKWEEIIDMKDLPYLKEEGYRYAYEKFLNQEVHDAIRDYSRTYRYTGDEWYYQIHCFREGDEEKYPPFTKKDTVLQGYQLEIKYILLRLIQDDAKGIGFDVDTTKTGFLIIAADNYQHEDLESIRAINQYGRRIYDPFLIPYLPGRESPQDIVLSPQPLKEYFCLAPVVKDDFEAGKVRVKTAIKKLFYSFFGSEIHLFRQGFKEKTDEQFLEINRILDDRMFVLSDYQLEEADFDELSLGIREKSDPLFKKLCRKYEENGQLEEEDRKLEEAERWLKLVYNQQKRLYSYIYIDNGDSTSQSPMSIGPLLQKSIYDRWLDDRTVYGITQHSMLMVTTKGVPPYLLAYFYSEYLEMILFVLTQRVRILSFSSDAGERAKMNESTDSILQLQKRYVIFKNQFLLPELSSQEQAVELYQMMQENFFILSQREILDDQITSLYEISQAESIVEERKRDEKLNMTVLALTVFTLFTALGDFEASVNVLMSVIEDLHDFNSFITVRLVIKVVIIVLYMYCIKRLIRASEMLKVTKDVLRKMIRFVVIGKVDE
ncbi:TPA: hypothetical protein ACGO97_001878 [Streptococcus suis]